MYIAHNVWINGVGGLSFGDNVIISPNCVIDTSRHVFQEGYVTHKAKFQEISIGPGTWIAANSTISYGKRVGKNCLIGANSVVTKDVEDNTMVAGVPAKYIKKNK